MATSQTTLSQKALRALKRKLGDAVRMDEASRFAVSYDGMKLSFEPEACVRIAEEEQVGEVLTLANKYNVPVTTRGGGSSLTGSSVPFKGGWVLDMTGLKRIRIDKLEGLAHVQAGAVLKDIQNAALRSGWMYPPDPSSVRYCTIGGTIACNAGGLRGAKYGVTRDYVVSLEGYLPTGERVRWGRSLKKWAVGYNLRDLWVGSEGTLGVVTQATMRLLPRPEKQASFLVGFRNEESALKAVRRLAEARLIPVALEFLDTDTVRGLEDFTGEAVFADCPKSSILLVEVDGDVAQVKAQSDFLRGWAKELAVAYREASTQEEAKAFWDVRRKASPAMFAHGDSKLNEDIVVPLRSQMKLMRFLRQLRKDTGLHIPTFGHAADGNFHVNIMYHRCDKKESQVAQQAVKRVMQAVVEMGGAISGEHGVGLAKSPYLRMQCSASEVAAMLAVKRALDPKGILNPGKIFEPYGVWQKKPEQVKLPWEHR